MFTHHSIRLMAILAVLCLCIPATSQTATGVTPTSFSLFGPDVTLVVTGTGFSAGDEVVLDDGLGGTYVFGTTYVSSTALVTTIPESALASPLWAATGLSLGISAGGITPPVFTLSLSPTMPSTVITDVSPGSAAAGTGPLMVSVTGDFFISGSVAFVWTDPFGLNPVPVATTVNSLTEVVATLPASLLATPGTVHLSIVNDPSGNFLQSGNHDVYDFIVHGGPFDGTLVCSSMPGGTSVTLTVANGTPGAAYQMLLAFSNAGTAPGGWLLGIDITASELIGQMGTPPLFGVLDGTGNASFVVPTPACPLGLTVDIVTLEFSPTSGSLLQWDVAKTVNL